MNSFVLTAEAEEDFWSIWHYIVQNSGVKIADDVKSDLVAAFCMLAEMPGIGHAREDLTDDDVFFFPAHRYMIVYRKSAPLDILAIIHGSRDVARVLDEREG